MLKWAHNKETVTADEVKESLTQKLPTIMLYRKVKEIGRTGPKVHHLITELQAVFSIDGTITFWVVTNEIGNETSKPYKTMEEAIATYNSK